MRLIRAENGNDAVFPLPVRLSIVILLSEQGIGTDLHFLLVDNDHTGAYDFRFQSFNGHSHTIRRLKKRSHWWL